MVCLRSSALTILLGAPLTSVAQAVDRSHQAELWQRGLFGVDSTYPWWVEIGFIIFCVGFVIFIATRLIPNSSGTSYRTNRAQRRRSSVSPRSRDASRSDDAKKSHKISPPPPAPDWSQADTGWSHRKVQNDE